MGIHFGVDYYPEHWSRERWEYDAQLMKKMGIQVVRMAEFSWHKLEPSEGIYDFEWLDESVNFLGERGILTVLGTPSAAPPAWMINRYPEILPVDREGRRVSFGGRHHDCQSNHVYRGFVRKMVEAMTEHYGRNPYVIGWQPDNELGNSHAELCTCSSCRNTYQGWLAKKYGTVDSLNRAWGNAFWSQEYNDFSEVSAPGITVAGENPSAMLDWRCFCSDLIVDFLREQTDIIRKNCPGQFITHNFMGFADKVDYYDLGKQLDFVSHDQYPGTFFGAQPYEDSSVMAASLDVVRSYKNKTFWIMEQQAGITGWDIMGRAPAPGQLSAWMMQSVAHGADTVVFFRWRTCAMGTEQYWHGILPHSGNPGRRYAELGETIRDVMPAMEKLEGAMPKAQAGIVFSFRQNYALQIQKHHPDLSYVGQVQRYYKALYDRQITVDFVPDDGEFGQYRLLIAPLQYLMTPELEERFFDYVSGGGHLVLTMRTGVKDEHNLCMTDRELPGRLGELAGVQVMDYDCLRETEVKIDFAGDVYGGRLWSDLIQIQNGTETLASYASEFYAGEPCITRNRFGDGVCYYIGTEPDEKLMNAIIGQIASEAAVESLGKADTGVELAAREKNGIRWLFAINHSAEKKGYLTDTGYRLLKGEIPGHLEPYEVHILEKIVKN